jgi:hypothetical protein
VGPLPAFSVGTSACPTPAGEGTNSAATAVLVAIVTTQGAIPVQPPPDQPANASPCAGEAVRVTIAPSSYSAPQAAGQAIPAG